MNMKLAHFLYMSPFNSLDGVTEEDANERTYYVPAHKDAPRRRLMTLRLSFMCEGERGKHITVVKTPVDRKLEGLGLIAGQQQALLHLLCQFHQMRENNDWDFWFRHIDADTVAVYGIDVVLQWTILRVLHCMRYEVNIRDDADIFVRGVCTSNPATFLLNQGDTASYPFVEFLKRFPDPTGFLAADASERTSPFEIVAPDHTYVKGCVMTAGTFAMTGERPDVTHITDDMLLECVGQDAVDRVREF